MFVTKTIAIEKRWSLWRSREMNKHLNSQMRWGMIHCKGREVKTIPTVNWTLILMITGANYPVLNRLHLMQRVMLDTCQAGVHTKSVQNVHMYQFHSTCSIERYVPLIYTRNASTLLYHPASNARTFHLRHLLASICYYVSNSAVCERIHLSSDFKHFKIMVTAPYLHWRYQLLIHLQRLRLHAKKVFTRE